MDPLRDYKPAERLSVRTVNELNRRAKRGAQGGASNVLGPQTGSTVVYIRNAGGSSDDCPQYGVLGVDGVAITHENNAGEFLNQPVLDGSIPTAGASSEAGHTGMFAIALEPIAAGDVGLAVLSGVVQVKINLVTEDDQFADIKDGDNTMLESSPGGGARILWIADSEESSEGGASGEDVRWALIDIGTGADLVRFQISSDIAVGRYNLKTYSGIAAPSGPHFGTLSSTENAIGFNKAEIDAGADLCLLKSGVDYIGHFSGFDSVTGKPVILFSPYPVGKTASPTTIGGNTEGSESASSSTWSRDVDATPVDVWIHSRQAYFHAGDEKWYAYARKFSYDACGLLIAVSAEKRIEIDAPEDC